MLDLRDQTFGMELEFTGITRSEAAAVLSEYFGGSWVRSVDASYDGRGVMDSQGRIWKVVRDGSLECTRAGGGRAGSDYSCEFVTPICKYEDLNTVQEIVRKLRKAGGRVNDSCGLHVHIGGDKHTVQSLTRLSFNIWAREDILYKALNVKSNRMTYCRKTDQGYIDLLRERQPQTKEQLADCWYHSSSENRSAHYNHTRYRALNLHAFFTKGTVEFRCFNATLHAGEVKSYIQFALGASAQAVNQTRVGCHKKTTSTNQCYTFRTWLIKIPLNGDEFKTCRYHLLKNLEGTKDWKDREAAMQRRAERAREIMNNVERMQSESGRTVTVQQIIDQPEREDPSQGVTTRQQIIMLLEDMQDASVEPDERAALRLILGLRDENSNQTRRENPIINWVQNGAAQEETTRRRRR